MVKMRLNAERCGGRSCSTLGTEIEFFLLGSVWFESFGGAGRGGEIFNLKCLVQFLEGEGREGEGSKSF